MYHIKEDKRAKKSAELIANAVMDLMERKDFDDITITDIEKKSSVARSTFYRLFDNTTDVLAYLCDRTFDAILNIHAQHLGKSMRDILIYTGEYWMENDLILRVIEKSGYQKILAESFARHLPETIEYSFHGQIEKLPETNEYSAPILVSIISSSLLTWVKTGRKETAEQLSDIIVSTLSGFTELYKVLS